MATKELSRADVLTYLTGSSDKKRDPALQDIEKIELYKFLKAHVPDVKLRDLVALTEKMCELPSYAFAKDMARDLGCGGFFASIKFTRNLLVLVEIGLLINPVNGVFGLSPKTLLDLDLLGEFLGRAGNCTSEQIWGWVKAEIRKVEATQVELKKQGINVWK